MAAIAAYVMPRQTKSDAWNVFAQKAFNLARPYVLSFSQWQKWDIFSPDPLRRSSLYSVDMLKDEGWQPLRTIDFNAVPWYDRAKELKILGRLEEDWKDMAIPFLGNECERFPEAAGHSLRLQAYTHVVPKDLDSLKRLSTTKLRTTEKTLGTVDCLPQA